MTTTSPTQGEHAQPEALQDFEVRKLAAIGAVSTSSGLVERRPIEYRRELEDQFVRGFRAAEKRLAAKVAAQPAAPQGGAYAELPYALTRMDQGAHIERWRVIDMMEDYADATHALRASHGQAPAPTPQADSQPAPVGADVKRLDPSQPLHVNLAHLAKSPKAAIEAFGAEWAGWCAASAIDALRAARAPADSGAAPMTPSLTDDQIEKVYSLMNRRLFEGKRPCYAEVRAMLSAAPTPPAQAADSVLEDAARLDWLDQQCEAYGFQDIHEGNRWEISGPYANVRVAIDAERAARKQGANHD
ncbi:hypothetical protein [Acidovorax sp.]|uniref:hypothetical protein n=1 Tax=Acidovorax sp. TaxID=1872122 RepID=UPI00391B1E6E